MAENEVEKTQEAGQETASDEQQPAKKPAATKPKATKTATKEKEAPAKVEAKKKTTSIGEIMATIKNMTVLDLAELVKALQAEFGITAAAPAPGAATAVAPAEAPAAEEEKTEFSVILKDVGANKISVIKAVRELTSLGLKESKDLVESAPKAVKEGITKDEAAAAKKKLEEAGATVEIK